MCDFSSYGGPSDEWLAVEASLPPPVANQTVPEMILNANKGREAIASKAMVSLSPKVHIRDHSVQTRDGYSLEMRSYRPLSVSALELLPVYMHFHGGGFVFGTLASEDAICARIAVSVNVVVVNVNYRHAPEFTYPTAWNDAEDAFVWLHSHLDEVNGDGKKVVLGGISAGSRLISSLVLQKHLGRAASGCPEPVGQVLMIPSLVSADCYEPQLKKMKDRNISSYVQNENAPILPRSKITFFDGLLNVKDPEEADTKLNPGNATPEEVQGLPPTVFGITGLDPLRDEGLLYAKMLTEAGVPTNTTLFKGVPHGFRRFGDALSASKRWDNVIDEGIKWALSNPAATYDFDIKE
ncbi:hypothetical protein V494_04273 [Pseudogymnoascus sp. VKM F-4513 (FW-928)]|nr:hypothetical protein V494_04273 [Pseudogymnoascus sp. VKM F-4513 (FW-928)]